MSVTILLFSITGVSKGSKITGKEVRGGVNDKRIGTYACGAIRT